jgi:hypothetical protein
MLAVAVVLVVVGQTREASAGSFGPSCCHVADSETHTFLYSDDTPAGLAWRDNVDASRIEDFNPLSVSTAKVSYHYNASLTWPYVDVSWWTANITGGGGVWCDKHVSGSSSVCDHWHMNFNEDYTSNSSQDYVVCQEIAHSFGLDHSTVLPTSCLDDTLSGAYDSSDLNGHDQGHINALYGH